MAIEVHRLQPVRLRDVWPNEATDFTPWLAANCDYLSEALGMDLELEGVEMSVGPFSADIVLRDTSTGDRVIVENMLSPTDHDHLGKLITYAAGLEAHYAVLVARELRPEHRSALTWLNTMTTADAGFFGIEVSAIRIADSPPAARFEVVVQPDDWSRQVRQAAGGGLTVGQLRYQEFWAQFIDELKERQPGWTNATNPPTYNWFEFPSGTPGVRCNVTFSWPDGAPGYRLRAMLYIASRPPERAAALFAELKKHRDQIENAYGGPLTWDEAEGRIARMIALDLDGVDPDDRDRWPEYRNWAIDTIAKLRTACQPVIDTLT